MRNHSVVSEFILLGLSADPKSKLCSLCCSLLFTSLALMGALMLLLVIRVDSQLHIPMYFFLGQLSFLDLCHSSVTVPKLLENLLSEENRLSRVLHGSGLLCVCHWRHRILPTCCHGLAAHVAITSPLLYGRVMRRQLYVGHMQGAHGLAFKIILSASLPSQPSELL